jgi:ABC-type transport system involved in cytochrome c biogenesis permease subunit
MALGDPKILLSLLTWLVYTFAMFARPVMGWTGRRAAWLAALGFAMVLLNLLPFNYFLSTSHTFD